MHIGIYVLLLVFYLKKLIICIKAMLISSLDKSLDFGMMNNEIDELKSKMIKMENEAEEYMIEHKKKYDEDFDETSGLDLEDAIYNKQTNSKKNCKGKFNNEILINLSQLIIGFLAVFDDEEHFFKRYHIPHSHQKNHFNSHALIFKKLQKISMKILMCVNNERKGFYFILFYFIYFIYLIL
jgi:hypothetical protein